MPATISSGRQMSLNTVDSRKVRLKNTLPAMNRHSAVDERVAEAVALPDGRREQRQRERRHEREHQQFAERRSRPGRRAGCSRETGSDSVNSAPPWTPARAGRRCRAGPRRAPTSAAGSGGTTATRRSRDTSRAAASASLTRRPISPPISDVGHRGQQLDHSRIGEHGAARRDSISSARPIRNRQRVSSHDLYQSMSVLRGTVSRKISLSVTGDDVAPTPDCSARASSRTASAPALDSTVSTRPLRAHAHDAGRANVGSGASPSNTSWMRRKFSRRSSSAPGTTARPRSMIATWSAIWSTSAI